ncbi:MAG: dimethyl sulfoxide reductase anchor subunit [Anaerolineae bacterium]|jgi:anaerobic dimethyl sulfoxide reductase subunit C (anchor subunit)|nr:dimethyl sulfoxide reductase anchor subunit [Anaerolineae bacterium]
METREWALVFFTIAAQMSVGSFVVLGIVHFFATRKAGIVEADRLSDRALLAIGPVLVLGLLASLLHLGTPLKAYRAISNLGESWLSWEILFGVLFAVLGAAFAFMQWRKLGTPQARQIVAILTAIVGLALVFAMSQVYMVRTQPAWDTLATPISFFATTLLLGVVAVGAAFVATYTYFHRKNPDCAEVQCGLMRWSLRFLGVAAILLVGVQLVVLPLYLNYLASGPESAVAVAEKLQSDYTALLALRLILVFAGAGVLGAFVYQQATQPGRERTLALLAYGAFALVLVAEVIGRFLFYISEVDFFPLG